MIELRISLRNELPAKADVLRLALANAGVHEEQTVETFKGGKTVVSFFLPSAREARSLGKLIRSLKLQGISVSTSVLKDADWKTRWKKYFRPFNITRDIRIVPVEAGSRRSLKKNKRVIYLDTSLAFGTGMHATTRMMAQLIASQRGKLARFLDVGSGSGILSLVASRYGAEDITAIDVDPQATRTCRGNLLLNACKAVTMTIAFEDFSLRRKFDFVAANLLTLDLIALRRKLASCVRRGGCLAVSGIYYENFREFRENFKNKNLECRRVLKHGNWYAALFKKR